MRGLTAARLLAARNRIFDAQKGGYEAATEEVLDAMVQRFAQAEGDQVALVVDLNRPLEGVLALAALCDAMGIRFGVFVPPQDAAIVRAGAGSAPPLVGLADCDCVLAVGDVFSSHPPVARTVRDVQFGARGNRLISVDSGTGRTGRGADQAVVVDPHKLAGCVAALAVACGAEAVSEALGGRGAAQICEELDLCADEVKALAADLQDADSVGVLVCHTPARYVHPGAAVAAARQLAGALGAPFWALPVATNAVLVPHLRRVCGAMSLGEAMDAARGGELKVLACVGFDPAAVLAEGIWRQAAGECETICWAGTLSTPFVAVTDLLVPLALGWEEEGTVLDLTGQPARSVPWVPKPPTVLSLTDLAGSLAATAEMPEPEGPSLDDVLGADVESAPLEELIETKILDVPQPEQGRAILIGKPEPQGYTGGLSVAEAAWQRRMLAEEVAVVTAPMAEAAGLDGAVTMSRNDRKFTAACRVEGGTAPTVAVPDHWAVLRDLAKWQMVAGELVPAPTPVDIERAE